MDSRPVGRGGGPRPALVRSNFHGDLHHPAIGGCHHPPTRFRLVGHKGGRQKLLGGFFQLRGYPPPLAQNSFAKKPLADMGGDPPPPTLTENHQKFV